MRVHEGAKEMICPFEMANVGLPVKSLQGHSSNQEDHMATMRSILGKPLVSKAILDPP